MGFEAMRTRAPAWERGALHTRICRGGFGLMHVDRDRTRDAAIGSPLLHKGDLYHFSFAVFGGGSGVVVGVADAKYAEAETVEERAAAWGLNLSHGCLYVKKPGKEKGELHSQQLVPLPALDRSPEHHLNNMVEIEVEVDLTTTPYRLGFGLPEGPMVHAAAASLDCQSLRPWVYLWGASDAIVLLPRRRPKAARMEPWKHSIRPPLSFRVGQSITGLASTAALRLSMAATYGGAANDGNAVRPPSRRHPRAVAREVERAQQQERAAAAKEHKERMALEAARAAEAAAEEARLHASFLSGSEAEASFDKPASRPGSPQPGGTAQAEAATGATADEDAPGEGSSPKRPGSPGGHPPGGHPPGGTPQRRLGGSPKGMRAAGSPSRGGAGFAAAAAKEKAAASAKEAADSTAAASREADGERGAAASTDVASGGGASVPGGLSTSAGLSSTAGVSTLALARGGQAYTYYDDPRRKKKRPARSHLEEFSLDAIEERKRALQHTKSQVKSYPWDVVKRVTGIYSDVTQQL